MARIIVATTAFRKKSHKFLKKHPELEDKVVKTLTLLKENVFSAKLYTHRLHGGLEDFYAVFDILPVSSRFLSQCFLCDEMHELADFRDFARNSASKNSGFVELFCWVYSPTK